MGVDRGALVELAGEKELAVGRGGVGHATNGDGVGWGQDLLGGDPGQCFACATQCEGRGQGEDGGLLAEHAGL